MKNTSEVMLDAHEKGTITLSPEEQNTLERAIDDTKNEVNEKKDPIISPLKKMWENSSEEFRNKTAKSSL